MIVSAILRKGVRMNMILILSGYLARPFFWVDTCKFNLSALCNSCAKIVCCSSELIFTFLYAGSSIRNAFEQFLWCIHLCFVNFVLCPMWQTQIGVRSVDSNSSVSLTIHNYTRDHINLFSHNDRYYHFPKHWPLFLHHNVCTSFVRKVLRLSL
jgi:hypothetical protein